MKCIVPSCDSDFHGRGEYNGYSRHRFPTNPLRREVWLQAIAAADASIRDRTINFKISQICSLHFTPGCIEKKGCRHMMQATAVPTIFGSQLEVIRTQLEESLQLSANEDQQFSLPAKQQQRNIESNNVNQQPEETAADGTKKRRLKKKHRKTIRYLGDLPTGTVDPKLMEQAIPKLRTQLLKYRKQVKFLRHQNWRLNIRMKRMQELCDQYKKLANKKPQTQPPKERIPILEELCAKRRGDAYSEAAKNFATTLHLYSPRAYEYVWKIFGKTMPHPRTLMRWQAIIRAKPNETNEAPNDYALKEEIVDFEEPYIEKIEVLDETREAVMALYAETNGNVNIPIV